MSATTTPIASNRALIAEPSTFDRVDRSFQTAARAEPARPDGDIASDVSCRVRRRPQTQLARDRLHRVRDRLDVLVQLDAEELRTRIDLVAVHAGGERGLLELLLDGLRGQRLDPVRPHQPARVDEPGQLVAREQSPLEIGVPRHLQVLGVRQHGLDQFLRIALLAQDRGPVLRMLVERGVDLVVEVVEQGRRAPELLVAAQLVCISPHRGLDGKRMPQERLVLCVTSERVPGPFSGDFHVAHYHSALVSTTLVAEALMESFVIEGGTPLSGRVSAAGNKNGALPILAATVIASEPVVLSNVPRIRDVETMLALLADIGADVDWIGPNEVRVDSGNANKFELDPELCSRIRASFLLAGPLLARFGRASVPPPGGDVIGRRRLDPHIHALVEPELCSRIRASFLLAGPLLARFGRASVPPPGGDVIGRRRLDPHIHALVEL